MYPFSPDAIDYDSILMNNESTSCLNTSALTEVATNENNSEELPGFLTFLESMIDKEKLSKFILSSEIWSGEIEDTSLFCLWKKISNVMSAEICFETHAQELVYNLKF